MELIDFLIDLSRMFSEATSVGSWLSGILDAYFALWVKVVAYLLGCGHNPRAHQLEIARRVVVSLHGVFFFLVIYLFAGFQIAKYQDEAIRVQQLRDFADRYKEWDLKRREEEAEKQSKSPAKKESSGDIPTPKDPSLK
jgi:hypothetical protein